ncbi:MAG: glycosyl hydrolase, partial [Saprospiraceae bacterium]|nr:glycosyl hydrolase [Saprospiraceae bacterium]
MRKHSIHSVPVLICTLLALFIFCTEMPSLTAQPADVDPEGPGKWYAGMEYRLVGPFRGGRSCTVTGVPGKPNLYYFGSVGGGVWKTEDGGMTYENISDGYFGGSIGAVAVSESDPNIIYVGQGEKTVRGNVSSGFGVWKSEDAGETWRFIGLKETRH